MKKNHISDGVLCQRGMVDMTKAITIKKGVKETQGIALMKRTYRFSVAVKEMIATFIKKPND